MEVDNKGDELAAEALKAQGLVSDVLNNVSNEPASQGFVDEGDEKEEGLVSKDAKPNAEELNKESTEPKPVVYRKLADVDPEELKAIEAKIVERTKNWTDDEDSVHEEMIKSFLLVSQFGAAGLLTLCSLIPKTSVIAGSWYQGLFFALLLVISGLFVRAIYWMWAPLCSLIMTLCMSMYFLGQVVKFYHNEGFLAFLGIFFSSLVGLTTIVIMYRIYKTKSLEL